MISGRILGKRTVIYAHGEELTTWRRSKRRLRAMRKAFRLADTVIANSEFTRSELIDLGVTPEKIALIYPGVDVKRFYPRQGSRDVAAAIGIETGQVLVLSVGRLSRRKGFDKTIQAVAQLRRKGMDVQYVIIGIGEDRDYLAGLAKAEGIEGSVHLVGHVSSEDLAKWYNACDVFAMPNREIDGDTEGFGMVFIEAAACMKPSVAGNAGGTGDAVIDRETGFRVDGNDRDAIVQALTLILTDQDLARKMGKNGYDRVQREFDWRVVADKTRALAKRPRFET